MRLTPRFWLSQGGALVDTMLAHCGLAQVPLFMVDGLLSAGALVEVLPAFRPRPLDLHLVTLGGRRLVPRIQALLSELTA